MSRTVILFVCVFALAASVAQAKRTKSQAYKPKHNGTKHAVHEINIEDERGQIALSSLANEFVHSMHEGIFLINQAIQNAQENPEFKKKLIELSDDSTDLAFAIQKEIHGDPRQLEYQIKSAVIFLTVLLPEITQLAETHESTTFASSLLSEAIDSILFAVQKLEVRSDLAKKTNDELSAEVIKSFDTLFETLKNTQIEEADLTEELHIQAHHLNHILDKFVNKLEVWVHADPSENDNTKIVEEVAQNLGTLTADLRKSISATLVSQQLKDILKNTLTETRTQVKKLGQVETNANQANQEHAKDIYRDSLYEAIAIAKTFCIKLEFIAKITKA